MRNCKSAHSGFTLVEVAIAIALLGIGLMTLTALATRLMNDTQEEINRTRASFFGQYILEVILADRFSNKNSSNSSQQGSSSGSLFEKLQAMNYFDGLNPENFAYIKTWSYDLKVESINLPLDIPAEYEKYSLAIQWGTLGDQYFNIESIKKAKSTGGSDESDEGEDDV